MKITAVETIRLGEFPNLIWVHIHTDEGLIGLGETFFGPRAVEAQIHETVAPLILDRCRSDLCWEFDGAVSSDMKLSSQAARSIG